MHYMRACDSQNDADLLFQQFSLRKYLLPMQRLRNSVGLAKNADFLQHPRQGALVNGKFSDGGWLLFYGTQFN